MYRWSLVPTLGRDPDEPGRTSTPLELFFDLTCVVAVSLASQNLRFFLSDGEVVSGIVRFGVMFIGVWWAWMGFTWYGSQFAQEDWLYRLISLVQMAGAIIFAAGVPAAMNDLDFRVAIIGYVVMRLAMSANWLRVAREPSEHAALGRRYVVGIVLIQGLWLASLAFPQTRPYQEWMFLTFAMLEPLVPAIAERGKSVAWHRYHVAERYGLFTIIVLGESILASAFAIVNAIQASHDYTKLIILAISAFVIVS